MTDVQTAAMIEMAGRDMHTTAGQHEDTGKWHGLLYVNHPTPSGSTRYLLALSDSRGWDDAETALEEFRKLLPPSLKRTCDCPEAAERG